MRSMRPVKAESRMVVLKIPVITEPTADVIPDLYITLSTTLNQNTRS
jgi:hypothetical protein